MRKKIYLVVTKTTTQTKNRLQHAVAEYLHAIDRHVLSYDFIGLFVNTVNSEIELLNQENCRCTPIEHFAVNSYDMERALEKDCFDFVISTNGGQFLIYLYQMG